jgi:two-component system, NtrC family, response regulator HydG
MRSADLDIKELLDIDADGGVVRFAGARAIILDAVAMGLLRKQLVQAFGRAAARAIFTRFGFAHGFRMAEAMRELTWDSHDEWRDAGARIHMLQGILRLPPGVAPLSPAGAVVEASYEAEQHLVHLGLSDAPVCWTLSGFASGYLSRTEGKDVYVIEDRCIGRGDAVCHFMARTAEGWGAELEAHLPYFERDCPGESLERAALALKRLEKSLRKRERALGRATGERGDGTGLGTHSPSMEAVLDLARRVAKVDTTLLITGESGAGKERVARLVHDTSARAAGPFVAINCGAITETLLESELFGHARGAFTGATQDRAGLFEAAGGGTLFLDEVGDLAAGMQVKLLRALQERTVRRVGENRDRSIDVRVVAATNRDLDGDAASGRFRKDLYYRLKVVELHVPPLRERREDILPLARELLAEASRRMKRAPLSLSSRAADQLVRHTWPGNVRELQNAMERAAALAQGKRVEPEDLPEEVRRARPAGARTLEAVEREHILAALERNGGNQGRTAAELGIGASTLYRKLRGSRTERPSARLRRGS